MALEFIITDAGRLAAFDADHKGISIQVATVKFGDQYWQPDATATDLKNVVRTIDAIGGNNPSPMTLSITVTDQDETLEYNIREIGIYLDDGTLFALVTGNPIDVKTKSSVIAFVYEMPLVTVPPGSVEVNDQSFNYPQATETMRGVATIATDEDVAAGTDDQAFITPKKLATASWKINAKAIGNSSTSTDLNTIHVPGFYRSKASANKWENRPESSNGAFMLRVESIQSDITYARQTLSDHINSRQWARVTISGSEGWTEWELIVLESDSWKINAKEIGNSSTSTDLNTIVAPGEYKSKAWADKFSNSPMSTGKFTMTVDICLIDSIRQTLRAGTSIAMYVRTGDGETWGEWESISSPSHVGMVLTTLSSSNPNDLGHSGTWEKLQADVKIVNSGTPSKANGAGDKRILKTWHRTE